MGGTSAFAFVEMDTAEAARQIIEVFDNAELLDSVVTIKETA